jgi:hypothetical protein
MTELELGLIARWGSAGRQQATSSVLREQEKRLDVAFAPGLDWFFALPGLLDGIDDSTGISFLSINALERVGDSCPDTVMPQGSWVVFAEFLVWSHGYAVEVSAAPFRVVLVGGPTPRAISESIHEFLDAYLREDDSILHGIDL